MNRKKAARMMYGTAFLLGILAAVFALKDAGNTALLLAYRLIALFSAAGGVILCVCGMSLTEDQLKIIEEANSGTAPVSPPPPPAMPAHLSPVQLCEGSIGGAVHALEQFAPRVELPICAWQLERCSRALTAVLDGIALGADPALAVDFAALYLPSAMQYIAACAAEGCPENAADTLAHIACACEKQQDALAEGVQTIFEMEYRALRLALEEAGFRWEKN